jgi:hypothetical protein
MKPDAANQIRPNPWNKWHDSEELTKPIPAKAKRQRKPLSGFAQSDLKDGGLR